MPGITTLVVGYIILTVLGFLIGIGTDMFDSHVSIFLKIRRSVGLILCGWFLLILAVVFVILDAAFGFLNLIFCFKED